MSSEGQNVNLPSRTKAAENGDVAQTLASVRDGSEAAFEKMVADYRPLLDAAIAQYRAELSEQDLEELRSEELVAFHRACEKYRPCEEVSFGLYAKICVNKALISALRRTWRRETPEILSLDDISERSDVRDGDPSYEAAERERVRELCAVIENNLSKYENSVWWLHYSGLGNAEIAVKVGKSEKSVDNALCRIRRKLRTLLSK